MDADRPSWDDGPIALHLVHRTRTVDEQAVRGLIQRALDGEGFTATDLSVVLADHATVHALNREWLEHDFETDVVSFPLDDEALARQEVDGEIYVDLDTAAERATEFGATYESEALRYIVHGLLHLMGYDDATDAERATMRALEDRYLRGEDAENG